jgi:hypothetical protein
LHDVAADVSGPLETVLRVAVEADQREAAECFARELIPLITSGPQGTTGYAEGRPRVHPVFRYWPCLIDRNRVTAQAEFLTTGGSVTTAASPGPRTPAPSAAVQATLAPNAVDSPRERHSTLHDIAYARSGDKGTSANVGIIARNADSWPFLRSWLTADRVGEYFAPLGTESVERFELPNLAALNFVLRGILRNSLRTDAQGKALGQILLEMPLPQSALSMMNGAERTPDE